MRSFVSFGVALIVAVAGAACSDGGQGSAAEEKGGSAGDSGGGGAGGAGASTTAGTGGATSTGGAGGTTTTVEPTGCEAAGSDPVSFANDVQPIFQASCGGGNSSCHFKALPSGGLSLKPASSYAEVHTASSSLACNGKEFIVPGDAAHSYFVAKLVETGKPAICGKRMPYDKPALPAADIQTIVDWVCQGALDN